MSTTTTLETSTQSSTTTGSSDSLSDSLASSSLTDTLKDPLKQGHAHAHDDSHGHSHGGPTDTIAVPEMVPPSGGGGGAFLNKEASLKVLEDAFGTYKTMTGGTVSVHEQAGFQAEWDKIYGETKYKWSTYVTPGSGNLEGFAYKGVNYINSSTASLDTVPHEMLHSNDSADWVGVVGSEFNEGTTEYMTIHAIKKAGKIPSHSYPKQEGIVSKLVANGLAEANLFKAYLKGGAKALISDWVDKSCVGSFAEFKVAMQAKSWAVAEAKIAKK